MFWARAKQNGKMKEKTSVSFSSIFFFFLISLFLFRNFSDIMRNHLNPEFLLKKQIDKNSWIIRTMRSKLKRFPRIIRTANWIRIPADFQKSENKRNIHKKKTNWIPRPANVASICNSKKYWWPIECNIFGWFLPKKEKNTQCGDKTFLTTAIPEDIPQTNSSLSTFLFFLFIFFEKGWK